MRDDMAKVIVERPRPGSSRHVLRRFRRLDPRCVPLGEDDDDLYPNRIGHSRAVALSHSRSKSFNENLAPLRRYLDKQAGRPWDDVWSEICANISVDNVVQKHVRDHVEDFVAVRTTLRNGEIMVVSRYGAPEPLRPCRWRRLYVHPLTGVLCPVPSPRAWRAERKRKAALRDAEIALRMRVLAPDRQLHLLDDGNWWEVTLGHTHYVWRVRADTGAHLPPDFVDVVERAGLSKLPREERYGMRAVHAIAKRPLSRREIKLLKLRPR